MKEWGLALVFCGIIAGLIAWLMPVSIETSVGYGLGLPSSVVNLGKLQAQMMVWHGALAAIVAGCVLQVGAELCTALALGRTPDDARPAPSVASTAAVLTGADGQRLRGPAAMAALQAAQPDAPPPPEWEDKPESSVWWPVAIGIAIVLLIAVIVGVSENRSTEVDPALTNVEAIADNLEMTADNLEAAADGR